MPEKYLGSEPEVEAAIMDVVRSELSPELLNRIDAVSSDEDTKHNGQRMPIKHMSLNVKSMIGKLLKSKAGLASTAILIFQHDRREDIQEGPHACCIIFRLGTGKSRCLCAINHSRHRLLGQRLASHPVARRYLFSAGPAQAQASHAAYVPISWALAMQTATQGFAYWVHG